MSKLKPKVVLITGCSSGFGYLTAKHLISLGHVVIPTVRKKTDLALFTNTIQLDVTWPEEKISQIIKEIITRYKGVDILINNAGFGLLGKISDLTTQQLHQQFETNLFGVHAVTRSLILHFRKYHGGLVINVSSVLGLFSLPQYGFYTASKYALEAYSQTLRLEESKNGLKVVTINPGNFYTKFITNSLGHIPPGDSDSAGENPQLFTSLVEKIICSSNPKENYLIGREAFAVWLLIHLPSFFRRLLLRRYFGLN